MLTEVAQLAQLSVTEKTKGPSADTWYYGYNNLNQMISAKDESSPNGTLVSQATYVYDVFGNMIEEDIWTQSSGTTTVTRYGYDGSEPWVQLNGSNQLQNRYLYLDGVNEIFARIGSSGTAAWYLTDALGSVRYLTDNTGTVQDQITYLCKRQPQCTKEFPYSGSGLLHSIRSAHSAFLALAA